MKLWKMFLVATTAIILPLALVSVGYAQELNCWGLSPTRTDEEKHIEYSSLGSYPDREEYDGWIEGSRSDGDNELDSENSTLES